MFTVSISRYSSPITELIDLNLHINLRKLEKEVKENIANKYDNMRIVLYITCKLSEFQSFLL